MLDKFYHPRSMGGNLHRRVAVSFPEAGRSTSVAVKAVGGIGGTHDESAENFGGRGVGHGIGKTIAHRHGFSLYDVEHHLGGAKGLQQAYKAMRGESAAQWLHTIGNMGGGTRDAELLLAQGDHQVFGANPGRLAQINREQHGIKFTGSKTDVGRFARNSWLGPYTSAEGDQEIGPDTDIKPLEDDCIETVSFATNEAGNPVPLYKPSNKPGC